MTRERFSSFILRIHLLLLQFFFLTQVFTMPYSAIYPDLLAHPFLRDLLNQPIPNFLQSPISSEIQANAFFFGHPQWAKNYFDACHRDEIFKERWHSLCDHWDDQIVVDIGCGPGNLYATLGGNPQLLIGVDVAMGALEMAASLGYSPMLADAHALPFISEFADIVVLNATLHHCEDMEQVLKEAARLVRPGGQLIIDHDPQLSAWNYKGLALALYNIRLTLYEFIFRDLYIEKTERLKALETEVHHKPGHGVTRSLFEEILPPLGFQIQLYPHNHTVGKGVLQGEIGKHSHWRYPLAQWLSGLNPQSPEAALSLMCVARKMSP